MTRRKMLGFVAVVAFLVSCELPPTDLGGGVEISSNRTALAIEAMCEEFSIASSYLHTGRRIDVFSVRFPIEKRAEWNPEETGVEFHLGFGQELGPSFSSVRAIKKDFVARNRRPPHESNILPWMLDQALERNIDFRLSNRPGPDLSESSVVDLGISEVGFTEDFSEAVLFVDFNRHSGYYLYLRWNPTAQGYDVAHVRLVYQS